MSRGAGELSERHKRRIIYGAVGITVLMVLLIAILGSEDDPWREWLKEWQTLLTGLFAITAALITVYEMRRVDDRQETRHSQIVRLNLRSDGLRARRAAAAAETYNGNIQRWLPKLSASLRESEEGGQTFATRVEVAKMVVNYFIGSNEIAAAKEQFSPEIVRSYSNAQDFGQIVLGRLSNPQALVSQAEVAARELDAMCGVASKLADDLAELASEFE